jgi:hypothetical protein
VIQTEICPKHGELCLTFSSRICSQCDVAVPLQNIIMTEPLSTDAELVRIVPVGHAIHLLKEAETRLKSLHVQPRDVTIVGVRTEQLEAIDVVVARKSSRQARLDTDGLGEETEIERDAAKVLARRLSPMLAQLNNKSLSTEQLCKALSEEIDPSRARAAFVALAGSTEPISDGTEIIYQGSNTLPKKSVQVAGAKVHRIIANVCSFEWAARRADVRLTALPEPSPIFTAKDLGVRMINVSMHDDLSCWLSTQAMAFGEPIAMNLVINANLDARGIFYNAKLVDFPDAEKTSEKFRTMFAERMSSLFD